MNLHEYQSKRLFADYGIPVPRGIPVKSPNAAVEAAKELGGDLWVVKAQIHAGGRKEGHFEGDPSAKGGVRVLVVDLARALDRGARQGLERVLDDLEVGLEFDGEDLLEADAARDLAELIEAHADDGERLRRLPLPTVKALSDAGLMP